MLIVGFKGIGMTALAQKYPEQVIKMNLDMASITNDGLIDFIETIKENMTKYELVLIPYINEVILCLDTLAIGYTLVYPVEEDIDRVSVAKDQYNIFKTLSSNHNSVLLNIGETLEMACAEDYDWIKLTQEEIKQEEIKREETPDVKQEIVESEPQRVAQSTKKKITLQELIEEDVDITEADVRDIKSITNKFKVAMILQAQSRLKTVLKLCNVLDKLYNELVDRIDQNLTITDTASLMYTTDYIAKALSETNQFIMSLVTNEKIQNFFIIDNSNIINITDDRVDINKREKIRKAAEIVLDNTEYFASGQFDKVVDPNVVFEDVSEEDTNASETT